MTGRRRTNVIDLNPIPYRRGRPGKNGGWFRPGAQEFNEAFRYLLPADLRNAKIEGPVAIELSFWRRGAWSDGDNLEKAVFDALVAAQVLMDDRQVKRCAWEVVEQGPKVHGRIGLTIEEL